MQINIHAYLQPPYAQAYLQHLHQLLRQQPSLGLPENLSGDHHIFLCDRDRDIQRLCGEGKAVIAVSHPHNRQEDLMGSPWLVLAPDALTPDFLKEVYCRHNALPLPVGQTSRCLIRELTLADLPELLSLQQENLSQPDGCFFPAECPSPEEFLRHYIDHQYPFYDFGLYAIIDKTTETFMGIAGISEVRDTTALFGYSLLCRWQKQGIAREVVSTLLEEEKKKERFTQFAALIAPSHQDSLALARHCGLTILH